MASNQLPLNTWGWGLAVGLGMFEVLIDLPGQYSMWYNSSGKTGWAPPADHPIREVWSLFEKVKVEADEAKRWEYWLKIRDINKQQLWRIGVAGAGPAYYIVKNNFRNVPSGLIDDNTLRNEGLGMPQQFYFKQ
jgi:peptide/nickel transport system substrate-binding protein